jgi:predicted SprT family Zn-dependent metalloprotease
LLADVGIVLVTEEEQEHVRQNIKPITDAEPVLCSSLTLTNLPRTSFYHCSCGQNLSVESLEKDYDNQGNTIFMCDYCGDELSKQHTLEIVNHFQGN